MRQTIEIVYITKDNEYKIVRAQTSARNIDLDRVANNLKIKLNQVVSVIEIRRGYDKDKTRR
jgi:uncharacterized protein with PhoU and TrkA domain